MKILLTGATGYIGKRLMAVLLEEGHEVCVIVRDRRRFELPEGYNGPACIYEADLTDATSLTQVEGAFDVAFYLVHGMSTSSARFMKIERTMAENFKAYLDRSNVRQCIYLSGIVNDDDEKLSKHLRSRYMTERILQESRVPLTVLRAAIIIGSGSASFEIIRDLTEKLPLMIAPKWLRTRCQPIGIRNVLQYLTGVMLHPEAMGQSFDIGGPDVLTYREMLLGYARVRGLRRWIYTVPVFSPKLSSYWLYFVTSTSYRLATSLVSSMKNEVIVQDDRIKDIVQVEHLPYERAVQLAFDKIEQSTVISSWKDAVVSGKVQPDYLQHMQPPTQGVLHDRRVRQFSKADRERVLDNIWSLGGDRGWYYGTWLWRLRGFLDLLVGGVGLRRGRRDAHDLRVGDALDFWRVLVADRQHGRLLLFAEMRLPGEAWLEFSVQPHPSDPTSCCLTQTATYRPKGLLGRAYWYSILPLHELVFPGMVNGVLERV